MMSNNVLIATLSDHDSIKTVFIQTIANFTADEFEQLCSAVCPVIEIHARCTGAVRGQDGRPPNSALTNGFWIWSCFWSMIIQQCSILHSGTVSWARSSANDDLIFGCHTIWPSIGRCLRLADNSPNWPSIGRKMIIVYYFICNHSYLSLVLHNASPLVCSGDRLVRIQTNIYRNFIFVI